MTQRQWRCPGGIDTRCREWNDADGPLVCARCGLDTAGLCLRWRDAPQRPQPPEPKDTRDGRIPKPKPPPTVETYLGGEPTPFAVRLRAALIEPLARSLRRLADRLDRREGYQLSHAEVAADVERVNRGGAWCPVHGWRSSPCPLPGHADFEAHKPAGSAAHPGRVAAARKYPGGATI